MIVSLMLERIFYHEGHEGTQRSLHPTLDSALPNFVCRRRQTGDANSGVAFVADVEADQQSCDLFYDARILQFAAVEGANPRNLFGQVANDLGSIRIITADNHIA